MKALFKFSLVGAALSLTGSAHADMIVQMHAVSKEGVGQAIGEIVVSETSHGVVFEPNLSGLAAGIHGFHLHANPSCEAGMKDGEMTAALTAGGHYDPKSTGRHGLPWGDGHLGDLPALFVDADGKATYPVLAPRLELSDVKNRSLMIHAGGDNHSDQPKPLGGGGVRVACGVTQ